MPQNLHSGITGVSFFFWNATNVVSSEWQGAFFCMWWQIPATKSKINHKIFLRIATTLFLTISPGHFFYGPEE